MTGGPSPRLEEVEGDDTGLGAVKSLTEDKLLKWVAEQAAATEARDTSEKNKNKVNIKSVLASQAGDEISGFGPVLLEHALQRAGVTPSTKMRTSKGEIITTEQAGALVTSIQELPGVVEEINNSTDAAGFIILQAMKKKSKKKKSKKDAEQPSGQAVATEGEGKGEGEELMHYEEFTPILLAQHAAKAHRRFATFNEAVDEFFSKIETQRAEARRAAAEQALADRQRKIETDQQHRMDALGAEQDRAVRDAALLEGHCTDVDNCMAVRT